MMIQYKTMVQLIVSFALFMDATDVTIINTAIPAIAHTLAVNPIDLKIALISYLLSLAIFIPISGWVADKFGMKRVFITALVIFIGASIWCGYSTNLSELVIARLVQGFGGSMTMPVARLIIIRTFERHELVNSMSRIVMVASIGMMLGPLLGGVITHYISWRWIFWVNIPIGVFNIILAYKFLKSYPPVSMPPLDKVGFILFGSSLAMLTFGLSTLSEASLSDAISVGFIVIAILLLYAYFIHSRGRTFPIVKKELFYIRTFQISALGNLFARLGFGGIPFLIPLLLQVGLGYPPQISGLLVAPTAIGVFLVKPFSLYLLRFFGYKKLLIVNTILLGLTLWSFMIIDADTSMWLIAFLTFLFGFLISLQYSGMNSLAFADTPNDFQSAATSVMSTLQQMAASLGVAIAAILLRIFGTTDTGIVLSVATFHYTFLTMGIITIISTVIFFRLKKDDGHELVEEHV